MAEKAIDLLDSNTLVLMSIDRSKNESTSFNQKSLFTRWRFMSAAEYSTSYSPSKLHGAQHSPSRLKTLHLIIQRLSTHPPSKLFANVKDY